MNDIVIEVKNATVRFNKSAESISGLKEYLIKMLKRELMFQEFLALKNINFTVKRGESWGLIGKNGSGKSTLLKLISGIIRPYQGNVTVNGSISPLIELGAGFDPELTARENIFLNGALLGYSKRFIESHFQEIVDFAELNNFIDVPIKNFSSGMSARLGFAIATVVEPDILIADEILAVGDFHFQEKCEKKQKEMIKKGTSVLFVSHSIQQIEELCDRVVWLEKGEVKMTGKTKEICKIYKNS